MCLHLGDDPSISDANNRSAVHADGPSELTVKLHAAAAEVGELAPALTAAAQIGELAPVIAAATRRWPMWAIPYLIRR
jgi:hypothetical protein